MSLVSLTLTILGEWQPPSRILELLLLFVTVPIFNIKTVQLYSLYVKITQLLRYFIILVYYRYLIQSGSVLAVSIYGNFIGGASIFFFYKYKKRYGFGRVIGVLTLNVFADEHVYKNWSFEDENIR